jgi:hypothetical protein
MLTVLRIKFFRFHFYPDDGKEPSHIHVATSGSECKFLIEPIRLAGNRGVSPHVIREIEKLVYEHCDLLKEKYNEIHNY